MSVVSLRCLVDQLEVEVRALDAGCMDGHDALALLERVIEGRKLLGAAETLLVKRVDECGLAQREGHRSTADWLATRTGVPMRAAVAVVETARQLDDRPVVESALREGRISTDQAYEVTRVARVVPEAEAELVDLAQSEDLRGMQVRCRQVTAAAMTEAELVAREERIHKGRYHRRWIDDEGAACGRYRTTAAAAALLCAELDAERDRRFRDAQRGRDDDAEREPFEAYEVDALCALGERDARSHRGKRTTVILRADVAAIRRGTSEPGETCEIAGVGPVSVTAARDLLGDATLRVVLTDGVDVRTVVHPSRTVAATIRTALLWQHPECCVAGCHQVHGLENDHTVEYAKTGHTKLAETNRMCTPHHWLKTTRATGSDHDPTASTTCCPRTRTTSQRTPSADRPEQRDGGGVTAGRYSGPVGLRPGDLSRRG